MDITIRQATTQDALHVAAIIDIAGHGIDLDLWLERRDEDHSVLSAARRLVLDDASLPYHYTNACMIEVDGKVAGGMVGGLTVEDDAPAQWIPPYLVPLLALETRLPGYWSVVAVALYREFRGQGLAARLLDHAGKLANEAGARSVDRGRGHQHAGDRALQATGLCGARSHAVGRLWRSPRPEGMGDADAAGVGQYPILQRPPHRPLRGHLSPISWGRGTAAETSAPKLAESGFLAPAKRGRGGSGEARDGEGGC